MRQRVIELLTRRGWRLVEHVDLGTTAHVFVVDVQGSRTVLKVCRDVSSGTCPLRAEYRVLKYLSTTNMAPYVPQVGEWIEEVDGFRMEHLRCATRKERETQDTPLVLGTMLRTLHGLALPVGGGVPDDRPSIGAAIRQRLARQFQSVLRRDSFWTGLPVEDRPKLDLVRSRYATYASLLPAVETALAGARPALTHGDLSGDNLMVTEDGRLTLVDWGEARISAGLADVAYLLTYVEWGEGEAQRFLGSYFQDCPEAAGDAYPTVQALGQLYRYRACVKSLLWLNELGAAGMDEVGRAFFERQLRLLQRSA